MEEQRPFWGFLDILIFIGIGLCFFFVLGAPLILILRPNPDTGHNFFIGAMAVQLALYVAIYLALLITFRSRYNRPVFPSLGWRTVNFNPLWAVLWGGAMTVLVGALLLLTHAPSVPNPVEKLVTTWGSLIAIGFVAALIGPVFEELLFRGFLQPVLVKWLGVIAGILITAAMFGALHIPEYQGSWQHGLAITTVGAAFGYARYRTKSLIPSTIMHVTFNSISMIGLIYEKFHTLK